MAVKRYPFNWSAHAHDIELRRDVAFLDMRAMSDGEAPYDAARYAKLEKLREDLLALLDTAMLSSEDGRIAWFTGPQIGLMKETVAWAANYRADRAEIARRVEQARQTELEEQEELADGDLEFERMFPYPGSPEAPEYGPSSPWNAPGMSVRDFI